MCTSLKAKVRMSMRTGRWEVDDHRCDADLRASGRVADMMCGDTCIAGCKCVMVSMQMKV